MKRYEYKIFDYSLFHSDDEWFEELNNLGRHGWLAVFVNPAANKTLLAREIADET